MIPRLAILAVAIALLAAGALSVTGMVVAPGAAISRVIDGDTVELKTGERVRLLGIDTPEKGQPFAAAAAARLRELTQGRPVLLEKDRTDKDKYDRLLRYATVDGKLVEEALLREGLARVLIIPPDRAYEEEFRAWEAEAREAGRGIWSVADQSVFCVGISYYHPNAAGDDRTNSNDEFVELRNGCERTVELTGWVLGDAAKSRFTFGAFKLKPHAKVAVRSGKGAANETDVYWSANGPVWNNDGDTVRLWDRSGRLVLEYEG